VENMNEKVKEVTDLAFGLCIATVKVFMGRAVESGEISNLEMVKFLKILERAENHGISK
jgi:hypothetical protein